AARPATRERALFYGLLLLGALGSSWFTRYHAGGYTNVLIPAALALCVVGALGVHVCLTWAWSARPRLTSLVTPLVVGALCLIQFGLLAYDPGDQLPTLGDRRTGNAPTL